MDLTFAHPGCDRSDANDDLVMLYLLFQRIDPLLNEPGEIPVVSLLKLGLSPIEAGDQAAAAFAAAVASHFVWLVADHCVVDCQFFTSGDVSHRDENDLALQSQIRLA